MIKKFKKSMEWICRILEMATAVLVLAGILLTASLLASLAAFLFRKQKSIPFVPFLAAGSFFMMFV